jgi:hypothetical protein
MTDTDDAMLRDEAREVAARIQARLDQHRDTATLHRALTELRDSHDAGGATIVLHLYPTESGALLDYIDRLQEAVLICSEGLQPGWVIGPKQCDYIDELAAETRELRKP